MLGIKTRQARLIKPKTTANIFRRRIPLRYLSIETHPDLVQPSNRVCANASPRAHACCSVLRSTASSPARFDRKPRVRDNALHREGLLRFLEAGCTLLCGPCERASLF